MITFEDVTKIYKSGHIAIEEISFKIEAGEFVFLMGPSGSGKTTLLRLILREVEPSEGTITVADHDISKISNRQLPQFRRQIGSAFQDFKLIPEKSAIENVSLSLEIIGKKNSEIKKRASELLERVGLSEKMNLFPSQLSGGEVQRVAIARAVASEPVLLFADEPTGNLDPETSKEIVNLLQEIHRDGTTVIMSTHDVDLVRNFHYRQIHLSKGKLLQDTKAVEEKVPEVSKEETDDGEKSKPKKKSSKKKKKSS